MLVASKARSGLLRRSSWWSLGATATGLLSRIGLQGRITLLIGLTVAVVIGASVYIGMPGLDETEDAAEREQLTSSASSWPYPSTVARRARCRR